MTTTEILDIVSKRPFAGQLGDKKLAEMLNQVTECYHLITMINEAERRQRSHAHLAMTYSGGFSGMYQWHCRRSHYSKLAAMRLRVKLNLLLSEIHA